MDKTLPALHHPVITPPLLYSEQSVMSTVLLRALILLWNYIGAQCNVQFQHQDCNREKSPYYKKKRVKVKGSYSKHSKNTV